MKLTRVSQVSPSSFVVRAQTFEGPPSPYSPWYSMRLAVRRGATPPPADGDSGVAAPPSRSGMREDPSNDGGIVTPPMSRKVGAKSTCKGDQQGTTGLCTWLIGH